ncbi:cytochrome P450 [Streptomyces sp. M2CJ-2]|uniref:cytochrome P450 n=1 Tax=Streptomyces sp. M2CJ-2 TaxID=2803948 RepID=UPI001925F71E|nr:cytochrome P450 [Streptomyces sp. M2CJ-2]MBL3668052.1 cytochrome P450 [Streptomyces sp. M2CJ-2]
MSSDMSSAPAYPMARGCPFSPPAEIGRLREEEPVARVRTWDGSLPWLVTRYDDVRAILSDPRFSSDPGRDGYPVTSAGMKQQHKANPTFIAMDDPEHARHRRMITGEFSVRRTEALRPTVERITEELLDAMEAAGGTADLVTDFALPLTSTVICELLGVPQEAHTFFQEHSNALLDVKGDPARAGRAVEELTDYLAALVTQKTAEPSDDLLGRVVERRVKTGEMTEREVASLGILLLVAGHETTANQIALGVLFLLQNPQYAAIMREGDDKAVAAACEELLRLLTVTHIGRRRVAVEDVEVNGALIRAGEGVIASGDAANRDPRQFADPDRMDIHREQNHHVAFGYGIHQCLGQPIARIELQTAYPAILKRFADLRLAVPLDEIDYRGDMVVYGVHSLPVTWGDER